MPADFDFDWDWQQQNQYFQERFCAELIPTLRPFANVIYEMFNEGEWYDKPAAANTSSTSSRSSVPDATTCCCRTRTASPATRRIDAKVDVVTLHPQAWVGHDDCLRRAFAAPPKPYLYSEPVPEFDGEKPSLDEVRRSMWEIHGGRRLGEPE